MNMNQAALRITKQEAGKKQISIAQVKEVMRLLNKLTNGELYKVLRRVK